MIRCDNNQSDASNSFHREISVDSQPELQTTPLLHQYFVNRPMMPHDIPESRISLRIVPTPKSVMGQFYLHQLFLSRAKLKASSRTSALLAGFAMVAMVEIALEGNVNDDFWLLTVFSLCTTLLVAVHLFALMISTCVLPHVEAVVNVMQSEGINGQTIPQAIRSPHETMHRYIETAWIFSTVLGIILFLIEIGLVCWIRFYSAAPAKYSSTSLLVPIVLVFLFFAFQFYKKLVAHTYTGLRNDVDDLQRQINVFNEQSGMQIV